MKIYIVNLPRCRDRRENILGECARFELEPEAIYGVDGQNLTEAELRELVFDRDRNPLGRGEIGCALSHLGIYRDMIDKDIPLALILEDDSVFNLDPRPLLEALARQPADVPEVYLLTHRDNIYIAGNRPRQVGTFKFHRGWRGAGANGYVITNKAAANILSFQTPLKVVSDYWKFFQLYDLIRFYICEKEIIGLHPETSQASASLLENDRQTAGLLRKKYFRRIRKQAPLIGKVKLYFFKIRNLPKIRYQ